MITEKSTYDLYRSPIETAGHFILAGMRDVGGGIVVHFRAYWWSDAPTITTVLAIGRGIIESSREDLLIVPVISSRPGNHKSRRTCQL